MTETSARGRPHTARDDSERSLRELTMAFVVSASFPHFSFGIAARVSRPHRPFAAILAAAFFAAAVCFIVPLSRSFRTSRLPLPAP